MKKRATRPSVPPSATPPTTAPRGDRRRKKATNLTLDPAAVARGEQYGARHGQKLSQLVNGFLSALPGTELGSADVAATIAGLSPAVRRLYGVAAGGAADRDAHRAHLTAKYGGGGA